MASSSTPVKLAEAMRQQSERSGAQESESFVEFTDVTEFRVRAGQVELSKKSLMAGVGLRVYRDGRMGFMYTTDIRDTILSEMVNRTLALTSQASPRDENKLSQVQLPPEPDLQSVDDAVVTLQGEDLISMARVAENSAFAQDKRIETVRDVRCGTTINEIYYSNTYVPRQIFRSAMVWITATPVATQGGQKRDGEFTDRKRFLSDLMRPEQVGETAARRALAKLGAGTAPPGRYPVVFDAEAAGVFLQGLFAAFSAQNVLEDRSFLAGKVGQPVASPLVTIVDDGRIRRGLGSRYFDGEGVEARRTVVVEGGTLRQYLHTMTSSRRMGVPPTGNGLRTYDTLPTVGPTNFYIDYGSSSPDKLVREIQSGLFVTRIAGVGADFVSGAYSQLVEGQWIEAGKLVRPVEGITISGNLRDMLLGIDGVGKDLEFRNNVASPTLRFRELTVAAEV